MMHSAFGHSGSKGASVSQAASVASRWLMETKEVRMG